MDRTIFYSSLRFKFNLIELGKNLIVGEMFAMHFARLCAISKGSRRVYFEGDNNLMKDMAN